VPLVRSFWLSTRKGKEAWIEPDIDTRRKTVGFDVRTGEGKPPPSPKIARGAKFRCLVCGEPASDEHIKAEGIAGRIGARLIAIVADGNPGRVYVSPVADHEQVARVSVRQDSPDQELPYEPRAIWCTLYGLKTYRDLFNPRQLVALTTLSDLVIEAIQLVRHQAVAANLSDDEVHFTDGGSEALAYAEAVGTYLALALDRLADFNCALSRWKPSGEQQMQLFGRQAIPMVWDFAEANVLGGTGITWRNQVGYVAKALERITFHDPKTCAVSQRDVVTADFGSKAVIISTDPPYYDNIGYADLSDFFYVWLRRTLGKAYPDLFSTLLTPKTQELVATPYRFGGDREKASRHFEHGFKTAFSRMRGILDKRFPMTLYYAFKQAEDVEETEDEDFVGNVVITTGWETFLEALLSSGFQITATWPVRASQKWRMVAAGTNALASYIVIACRSRPEGAPLATRREFVSALRRELPDGFRNLQQCSIAPVDLAQASIGPGMAVFSRYQKVLEADGSPMPVRTALQLINSELQSFLRQEEGEADRDTQFCVSWFEQYGMASGPFGEADVLARAKNVSVEGMVRAGVLTASGGKVVLLPRDDYPTDWNPAADVRLTLWECTQQLIKRHQEGGEAATAALVARLGAGRSDDAKILAYRLHAICERKGWTEEALAYNEFVVAWPEILKKAATITGEAPQKTLDVEENE
jgi:putative DNA methylase